MARSSRKNEGERGAEEDDDEAQYEEGGEESTDLGRAGSGDIEGIFSSSLGLFGGSLFSSSEILRPLSRIDVGRDSVTVTFDIPGVDREGITVTCTEDYVSVEAETRREFRSTGQRDRASRVEETRYSERVGLPVPVDPDRGTAKFNNGMLVVKLPRVQKGRTVKVTSGE